MKQNEKNTIIQYLKDLGIIKNEEINDAEIFVFNGNEQIFKDFIMEKKMNKSTIVKADSMSECNGDCEKCNVEDMVFDKEYQEFTETQYNNDYIKKMKNNIVKRLLDSISTAQDDIEYLAKLADKKDNQMNKTKVIFVDNDDKKEIEIPEKFIITRENGIIKIDKNFILNLLEIKFA